MNVRWHIAFCNVTYTEYAGINYYQYYLTPANMLAAQLAAKNYIEKKYGIGEFIAPHVDIPSCAFSSLFGMKVIESTQDEIPYLDASNPIITNTADADRLQCGNPQTDGLMAKRYAFWKYYTDKGYSASLGGASGPVISTAVELTGSGILSGFIEDPENSKKILKIIVDAQIKVASFSAALSGNSYIGHSYTGDDYSGLLSPAMYREFAVPCYQQLYANNNTRFMHSELLRAEHLRIARDEVGITEYHGAGCKNLTLTEMKDIMGERFWTQLTPQEMLELTPKEISERIRILAGSGCSFVQLYPGRGVSEKNMDAAITACRKECTGGPYFK